MRQNGSVQMQDPSASPTNALRRNLFASHLSRRTVQYDMSDPFHGGNPSASQRVEDSYQPQVKQHQQELPNLYHNPGLQKRSISPEKPTANTALSPQPVESTTSIIAVDPTTGRPLLPNYPALPSYLHANSNHEDDDEDEDITEERDHVDMNRASRADQLHEIIDTTAAGEDDVDLIKIEAILQEMATQQRARARATALPEFLSSSVFDTPVDNNSMSPRTRGKSRANTRSAVAAEKKPADALMNELKIGGIGATLDTADKDELLGLIMSSLRKKVQELDDDAWMFGDESSTNGMGGRDFGRDDT